MKQLNLLLFISLAIMYFSCNDSEEDQQPEPLSILTPCQYSFDFDGQVVSLVSSLDDSDVECNVSSSGFDVITLSSEVLSSSSPEYFRMKKGNVISSSSIVSPDQLDSLFSEGSHEYAQFANNGVSITYCSAIGKIWSSSSGSADQNGSTFEIVEVVNETILDTYVMNLRVKFNCNLYNENGEVKSCEGTAILGMEAF